MTESSDAKGTTPEPVGELLDVPGEVADDGQERNLDGQTRREFLEMLQESHDWGNVVMEDDRTLVEEDAIAEVGADAVALLRENMRAYLEAGWAELDEDQP